MGQTFQSPRIPYNGIRVYFQRLEVSIYIFCQACLFVLGHFEPLILMPSHLGPRPVLAYAGP